MAVNRFVVDLVTEEPLSDRELQRLASEMNDWLQAVGSDGIEGRNPEDTMFHGHEHNGDENNPCRMCRYFARDSRS